MDEAMSRNGFQVTIGRRISVIKRIVLLTVLLGVLSLLYCGEAQAQASQPKVINFCGYEWIVRSTGKGGPGPNQWSPDNVWLDKAGLHLKIRRVTIPATASESERTEWQCAELYTRTALGFGTYEFQVTGRIDKLDRNIVLGLFDYPTDDPDGTNEIDIEFARWGNDLWPNGSYTIYPSFGERDKEATHPFRFSFPDDEKSLFTTHRFTRERERISLQSLMGHGDKKGKEIASWLYKGASSQRIPQKALPVHINLWLFRGNAPSDNKEVEIIIRKFTFTPGF